MTLHSDTSFLMVSNGAVTVSAKLLASLVAANACSQRSGSRNLEHKLVEKELMRVRVKMATKLVLDPELDIPATEKRSAEKDGLGSI